MNFWIRFALAASLQASALLALAQSTLPVYRAVKLDSRFMYYDLGDDGTIVGQAFGRAARWTPDDDMQFLDDPVRYGSAFAISPTGVTVGHRTTSVDGRWHDTAVIWSPRGKRSKERLGGASKSTVLTLPGAINANNQVVGSTRSRDLVRLMIWEPGQPAREIETLDAGLYRVAGINSSGMVAGFRDKSQNNGSFVWTPQEGMRTITPANFRVQGINDAGKLVGTMWDRGEHPFVWTAETGLTRLLPSEGTATAVNNADEIIGDLYGDCPFQLVACAYLHTPSHGTMLISSLLDPQDPLSRDTGFASPRALNERGDLLVEAHTDDTTQLVKLIRVR